MQECEAKVRSYGEKHGLGKMERERILLSPLNHFILSPWFAQFQLVQSRGVFQEQIPTARSLSISGNWINRKVLLWGKESYLLYLFIIILVFYVKMLQSSAVNTFVLFWQQAIKSYNDSIAVQSEWKQFHHICYWELMWCYAWVDLLWNLQESARIVNYDTVSCTFKCAKLSKVPQDWFMS